MYRLILDKSSPQPSFLHTGLLAVNQCFNFLLIGWNLHLLDCVVEYQVDPPGGSELISVCTSQGKKHLLLN